MKGIKQSLCVIISIALVLVVLSGSIVWANNTDDAQNCKAISDNELRQKIADLNEKYPEANLNANEFINMARQMESMNASEKTAHIRNIKSRGPVNVYTANNGESSSTLIVYAPGLATEYGRVLGQQTNNGNTYYWTNTYVYMQNLWGNTTVGMSYYVNHNRSSITGVGYITNWSGLSTTPCWQYLLFSLVILNPSFYGSSESLVKLHGELNQLDSQSGGEYIPISVLWLTFNPSTLIASFYETSPYLKDPE